MRRRRRGGRHLLLPAVGEGGRRREAAAAFVMLRLSFRREIQFGRRSRGRQRNLRPGGGAAVLWSEAVLFEALAVDGGQPVLLQRRRRRDSVCWPLVPMGAGEKTLV